LTKGATTLLAAWLLGANPVLADEVEIVRAMFERDGSGAWRVSVTLRHADTGWEHYADAWRVSHPGGEIYGTRTLFHPHEDEQPFTRSLGGVSIPAAVRVVRVEAHDKVHGWTPAALEVDLRQAHGEGFEVRR
jgi:hypothetical protein